MFEFSRNFDTGGSEKYTMRYLGITLQWKELKKKKTEVWREYGRALRRQVRGGAAL